VAISTLKQRLPDLLPPHKVTGAEKAQLINEATSIVETQPARFPKPNVAGLGGSLYTDQLVTVAIAGALLFVALVGAVAITNPRRPVRPGSDPAQVAAVGSSRP
jgi:hypothetical protein